ncbi:MAG: non-canonical purine NTP pyrophosphatase [Frankiaceae bacterium]|nr:non-canonical purine NTP pyrophosphatase [Frankiaceae bacterium]
MLLATRNEHKLAELRRILADALAVAGAAPDALRILSLDDVPPFPEVPETGETFGQNALIKAREACARAGLPAIADDSGIAVDALHGMPGVLSARWAGAARSDQANLALLLEQTADVPDERRGARFVCAAALVTPGGREETACGAMAGTLLRAPRGAGGFGYDPIFRAEGQTRSNAELSAPEKDAISHRRAALRALAPRIVAALLD